MEYFWKENKKFVTAVGGGLVFLLLYYSFVLGPIRKGATDAARDRQNLKRDLERRMQQGVPNDDGLVAGRRDREANRKVLAQMAPEVRFSLNDRFVPRKNDRLKDLQEHYAGLKIDLVKELQRKSVEGKLSFPQTVGLPDDITTEENGVEVLARCGVVERLVTLAVESDLEKIEVIDAQYGMDRDERSSKKSQFLAKYSVYMKVIGKVESVFKMIHGAQKKGSYLAVTQFDLSRPDSTKDLFEASIAVAYLKVDDKAGLDTR
jgi:hypothetical protein